MKNREPHNSLIAIFLLLCVVLACANSPVSTRPSSGKSTPSPISSKSNEPKLSRWRHAEYADEMGRGKIIQASVISTNTISLNFPYEGTQHGTLTIRQHPQYGRDVILSIRKGQLLDSDYHDRVVVRFDEEKAISFPTVRPADLSTETLFLRGNAFSVFTNKLKTAKTLRIQFPVYQAGNQLFVFDVEGFTWKEKG